MRALSRGAADPHAGDPGPDRVRQVVVPAGRADPRARAAWLRLSVPAHRGRGGRDRAWGTGLHPIRRRSGQPDRRTAVLLHQRPSRGRDRHRTEDPGLLRCPARRGHARSVRRQVPGTGPAVRRLCGNVQGPAPHARHHPRPGRGSLHADAGPRPQPAAVLPVPSGIQRHEPQGQVRGRAAKREVWRLLLLHTAGSVVQDRYQGVHSQRPRPGRGRGRHHAADAPGQGGRRGRRAVRPVPVRVRARRRRAHHQRPVRRGAVRWRPAGDADRMPRPAPGGPIARRARRHRRTTLSGRRQDHRSDRPAHLAHAASRLRERADPGSPSG